MDALNDSGAVGNCMSEAELKKIKTISPDDIVKEMLPPPYRLQVANGDVEQPAKTVQLRFEIGDWTFNERFEKAKRIAGPILGPICLRPNKQCYPRRQPGTSSLRPPNMDDDKTRECSS